MSRDIHIESLDNRALVRFRVDGVLQEMNLGVLQESINKNRKEIISRIKILGKMDISEKRRPQDGSFRVRVERNGEIVAVDFERTQNAFRLKVARAEMFRSKRSPI